MVEGFEEKLLPHFHQGGSGVGSVSTSVLSVSTYKEPPLPKPVPGWHRSTSGGGARLNTTMQDYPKLYDRHFTAYKDMELKPKHQWSVEETNCFLAIWASSEVQHKLEGATRTKPVFKYIQLHMAAAGYDRSVDQIINKLKKLKKEYREKKRDIERSGNGRLRKFPHFEVIDAVLGVRPACQLAGSLNSATAICGSTMNPSLQQQPTYSGKLYFCKRSPCYHPTQLTNFAKDAH